MAMVISSHTFTSGSTEMRVHPVQIALAAAIRPAPGLGNADHDLALRCIRRPGLSIPLLPADPLSAALAAREATRDALIARTPVAGRRERLHLPLPAHALPAHALSCPAGA